MERPRNPWQPSAKLPMSPSGSTTPVTGMLAALVTAGALLFGGCVAQEPPGREAAFARATESMRVMDTTRLVRSLMYPLDVPLAFDAGVGREAGTSTADGGEPLRDAGPGGLGRACEADADCDPDQHCRQDPEHQVAHAQCTRACASPASCEESFGEDATCLRAEICVRECQSDADCPERTRCLGQGWCMRGGPDSGVPYCQGEAQACEERNLTCQAALGCTDQSLCSGVSASCAFQTTPYSCDSQEGCRWSSYAGRCKGIARSCGGYTTSSDCNNQDGCIWNAMCTGTPSPCQDLAASICEYQPDCELAGVESMVKAP